MVDRPGRGPITSSASCTGVVARRRLFRTIDDGLAGRSSLAELRELVLSMPFNTACRSAIYWCALSAVIVPWHIVMSSLALDGRWSLGVAGAIGTCAAEAALLTYLVVERTIRPLTQRRDARNPPPVGPRRMSMLRRLVVAFTVAIAVPLTVENVWILISADADRLASIPRYALVFNIVLVAIGLTSHDLRRALDHRSIARRAQSAARCRARRSRHVRWTWTESGEVGALQGGFNRDGGRLARAGTHARTVRTPRRRRRRRSGAPQRTDTRWRGPATIDGAVRGRDRVNPARAVAAAGPTSSPRSIGSSTRSSAASAAEGGSHQPVPGRRGGVHLRRTDAPTGPRTSCASLHEGAGARSSSQLEGLEAAIGVSSGLGRCAGTSARSTATRTRSSATR